MLNCEGSIFSLDVLLIEYFELIYRVNGALKPNPTEGRFLAIDCMALFNEANRLKNVGDIIEASYFGFQLLVLLFGLLRLLT